MQKLEAVIWTFIFLIIGLLWGLLQSIIIPTSTIFALFATGKAKQWGINCWEGKDNLISAQCGGDPDDSLSSRLGKARRKGSGWSLIANKVDLVALHLFNDPNHCEASIETSEGKKQVTTH